MKKIFFLLSIVISGFLFLLFIPYSLAVSEDELCYEKLHNVLKTAPLFSSISSEVVNKNYGQLSFTSYDNPSSFDLDLSSSRTTGSKKPFFQLSISSFGRKTPYKHPDLTTAQLAQSPGWWKQWDVFQHMILNERYVGQSETTFQSCGAIMLTPPAGKSLTSFSNALFSFEVLTSSNVFTDTNGDLVWYSRSHAMNTQGCEEMTFDRLFVVPKKSTLRYALLTVQMGLKMIRSVSSLSDLFPPVLTSQESNSSICSRLFTEGVAYAEGASSSEDSTIIYPQAGQYEKDLQWMEVLSRDFPEIASHVSVGEGYLPLESAKRLLEIQDVEKQQQILATIPSFGLLRSIEKSGEGVTQNSAVASFLQHPDLMAQTIEKNISNVQNNLPLPTKTPDWEVNSNSNSDQSVVQVNENVNGGKNINGETSATTSLKNVDIGTSPELPQTTSQNNNGWIVFFGLVTAGIVFLVVVFVKDHKKRLWMIVIIVAVEILATILVSLPSPSLQNSVITSLPRGGKIMASLCSQNLEFNSFATVQTTSVPTGRVVAGETRVMTIAGHMTEAVPFVVLCESGKVAFLLPTYKQAPTDASVGYKITLKMLATTTGFSVLSGSYVTDIRQGKEVVASLKNTACTGLAYKNSDPFREVQLGMEGTLFQEVSNGSLYLKTGGHTIYASYRPSSVGLNTGDFTLMQFGKEHTTSYTMPIILPPPRPKGN